MLSVLVDRPGSFVTRALSAVRLIVYGTGNGQEWTLSALSRNFTFFRNWPRMDGCQPALSWTYRDEDFCGTVGRGWGVGGRSPHNRSNWFASVAEVRRAPSSSSLDVSGMREKIMWLRCFIPLVPWWPK